MFAKISAINFFSWKELEFDFKSGVTLISGQNLDDNTSEGSGKSSIPNALCWGLYGQLPKDVNIDDVIKTGEKDCCVIITLENGTEIVRSRKPNELAIELPNGDDYSAGDVIKGKDMKETQKLINELIGMSFDTFCQSVYFAQNYSNKFITANQEEKAKILSELQDLSIFDRASKKASELLKTNKTKNEKLILYKMNDESMFKLYEEQYKTYCNLSDNFDNKKLQDLDNITLRYHKLCDEIKDIELQAATITNLDSISIKHKELEETNNYLNECNKKLYLIEQLKFQKQKAIDNQSCPTCGQSISTNTCKEIEIPSNKDLLNQKLILEEEISMIGVEYTSLLNSKSVNDKLIYRLSNLTEQRTILSSEISKLEDANNPYIHKITEFSEKLEQLKTNIELTKKNIDSCITENYHLEFLKDGFKEIKSYVFQSLLSELNHKANHYLKDLFEVPAYITFDNISEEGDISKIKTTVMLDGYERSLGLLSGGQFRRVQLAVDFALSDIVSNRSKNPINVRILDEAFKDLSEVSQSKVIDILQTMKGSTIIIEHNSLIKNIVNNVYNVQLKNGTSARA